MLKQHRLVQGSGAAQVFVGEGNDSSLFLSLHSKHEGIAGKRPKVPCELPSQLALALVELIELFNHPAQFRAGMYSLRLSEMGKAKQRFLRCTVQMAILGIGVRPESGPQNGFLLGRGQLHQPLFQEVETLQQGQSAPWQSLLINQVHRHLARCDQLQAVQKELLHGLDTRLSWKRLEPAPAVFFGFGLCGRDGRVTSWVEKGEKTPSWPMRRSVCRWFSVEGVDINMSRPNPLWPFTKRNPHLFANLLQISHQTS